MNSRSPSSSHSSPVLVLLHLLLLLLLLPLLLLLRLLILWETTGRPWQATPRSFRQPCQLGCHDLTKAARWKNTQPFSFCQTARVFYGHLCQRQEKHTSRHANCVACLMCVSIFHCVIFCLCSFISLLYYPSKMSFPLSNLGEFVWTTSTWNLDIPHTYRIITPIAAFQSLIWAT